MITHKCQDPHASVHNDCISSDTVNWLELSPAATNRPLKVWKSCSNQALPHIHTSCYQGASALHQQVDNHYGMLVTSSNGDTFLVSTADNGAVFLTRVALQAPTPPAHLPQQAEMQLGMQQQQRQWHTAPVAAKPPSQQWQSAPEWQQQPQMQWHGDSNAATVIRADQQQWQQPASLTSSTAPPVYLPAPAEQRQPSSTVPAGTSQQKPGGLHRLLAAIDMAEMTGDKDGCVTASSGKRQLLVQPADEPAGKRVRPEGSSTTGQSLCGCGSNTPRAGSPSHQQHAEALVPHPQLPANMQYVRTAPGVANGGHVQLVPVQSQGQSIQLLQQATCVASGDQHHWQQDALQQGQQGAWCQVPAREQMAPCPDTNSDNESGCSAGTTTQRTASFVQPCPSALPTLAVMDPQHTGGQVVYVRVSQAPHTASIQQSNVQLVSPSWTPAAPSTNSQQPIQASLNCSLLQSHQQHVQQQPRQQQQQQQLQSGPAVTYVQSRPQQPQLPCGHSVRPSTTSTSGPLTTASESTRAAVRVPAPWPDHNRAVEAALEEIMVVMLHKPRGRPVKYIDLGVNRMALKYHVGLKIGGRVESMGATDTELAAHMLLDMAKIGLGLYAEAAAAAPPALCTHPEEQMTSSLQHPPWQYSTAFVQRVVAQLINRNLVDTSELLHAYTRAHTAGCKPGPCLMSVNAALQSFVPPAARK